MAAGLGARLFGLGCYVGEAIRIGLGGVWDADGQDPAGEINVMLRLSDGSVIWPVQRVIKRFRNGPEDSLVAYALFLGLDVQTCNGQAGPSSPPPAGSKRRGLFRRRFEAGCPSRGRPGETARRWTGHRPACGIVTCAVSWTRILCVFSARC